MSRSPIARVPGRVTTMAASALLLTVAASSCTGSNGAPERADPTQHPVSTPGTVSGPLCARLPTGTDPGGPETLTSEPADSALQWIPVLTIFEAGTRATGLDDDLGSTDGVTILAPTDEAFTTTYSESALDELLIHRRRELRALLRAHMIDGELSLAQLLDAGRVTTLDGNTIDITPQGAMARFDSRAETLCADYSVANARIHVIDAVLGDAPPSEEDPPSD